MPQPPSRAVASKDLPPSVETAYYRKCIELRRRITDIEDNNDGTRLRITRLNRGIQKMRLERAFLLEQLNKHMEYNVDDSDRSSSPPPTPTDKPLRSKRSHNRKGTPPLGAAGGASSTAGGESERPAPEGRIGAMSQISHGVNTASSAQSTPDPGRPQSNYVGTATAASPPTSGVNGVVAPSLPPLNSLPALQSQQPAQPQSQPQRQYFDPAYDEQRPAAATTNDEGSRSRAHSGAAQQPPASTADAAPAPQNDDTEMPDASFTAVNR